MAWEVKKAVEQNEIQPFKKWDEILNINADGKRIDI